MDHAFNEVHISLHTRLILSTCVSITYDYLCRCVPLKIQLFLCICEQAESVDHGFPVGK